MLEGLNLKELSDKVYDLASDITKIHLDIIDSELAKICEHYNIPPEKLVIQVHPDGVYKISIVLSEFQINVKQDYAGIINA